MGSPASHPHWGGQREGAGLCSQQGAVISGPMAPQGHGQGVSLWFSPLMLAASLQEPRAAEPCKQQLFQSHKPPPPLPRPTLLQSLEVRFPGSPCGKQAVKWFFFGGQRGSCDYNCFPYPRPALGHILFRWRGGRLTRKIAKPCCQAPHHPACLAWQAQGQCQDNIRAFHSSNRTFPNTTELHTLCQEAHNSES